MDDRVNNLSRSQIDCSIFLLLIVGNGLMGHVEFIFLYGRVYNLISDHHTVLIIKLVEWINHVDKSDD